MQKNPFIFTFFSFKGGVGRTMAAVNTAYALASRGRDVLLVDMDIEAPGLSTFLSHSGELGERSSGDVLDLLAWVKGYVRADDGKAVDEASVADAAPNLSQFVTRVPAEHVPKPRLGECGRLDVLAVHDDRDYVKRLNRLGLASGGKSTVVALSRTLRYCLRHARLSVDVPDYYGDAVPREKPYDYILVDSRTGLTEIGGLCIGPLADRLVVLVALNDQNVTWTERFLKTVGVSKRREEADSPFDEADPPPSAPEAPPRLGPKPTILVASPFPSGETDLANERLKTLEKTLGTKVAARISYNALMAVKETIFVRDYPDIPLAGEYRALADQVMACVNDHAAQLAAMSQVRWNAENQRAEAVDAVVRLTPQSPDLGLGLLQKLHDIFKPETDADLRVADRMYRVLASSASTRAVALNSWGVCLSKWSAGTPEPRLKELRLRDAVGRFAELLEMPEAPSEQKAKALLNRAVAYSLAGKAEFVLADSAALLAMPDVPIATRSKALFNRAVAYSQAGQADLELADLTSLIAMPDAPAEQRASALVNRAIIHGEAGRTELAIADCSAVVAMPNPPVEQKAKALLNRGNTCLLAGREDLAIADYAAVLDIAKAPVAERATAFLNRSLAFSRAGKSDLALADLTAVISMADAPAIQRAAALVSRALAYSQAEKTDLAIADYSAVLAMPDAPAERKSEALVNRGGAYIQAGEADLAMADYAAVLAMPDAPPEQKAKALGSVGWLHYQTGRFAESAAASRESLALDPSLTVNRANLGLALLHLGRGEEARAEYAAVLAQTTSVEELERQVVVDLREALKKRPDLQGAREVLDLAEQRRLALAQPTPSR